MKPYLFLAILLFISCTNQGETKDKNEHGTDYVTAVQDLKKVNAGNGEWVYQMEGHEHDFNSLSFAITETEPGGGPPLHVHETEEAHILMNGKITYHIGDSVFTATGPFVARVPPNVPHTFINSGDSTFNLIAVFPRDNFGTYNPVGDNPLLKDKPVSQEGYEADFGYSSFHKLSEAREYASKVKKPLLIVFTGWASMGDHTAPWRVMDDDEVRSIIEEKFVLVTLYVDDRQKLATIDSSMTNHKGNLIETVGQWNSNFQVSHFNNNAQPFYAIVDAELNKLTEPIGYVPESRREEFVRFLEY